jgi:coenzyme F420-0:L-glutamate ligase/coenzyme F420-1:gamma-L-glutamate ligase
VLSASAVEGLPELSPGDDLAALIAAAVDAAECHPAVDAAVRNQPLSDLDVLVVAHKVISKAEGRIRLLSEVRPGHRAVELAERLGKDPRHVQVVLDESREVLRAAHGVLICVTHHGFVCANAGVDTSNVAGDDAVVVLPLDPDRSARGLRARLRELTGAAPAVVITDSFGRAWRHGQCDVAIGCAGIAPLEDWRGSEDSYGRKLRATIIAVADQLAAAADLARVKDGCQPAVLVRGAGRHVTPVDGPGARALIRPEREDLFR